MPQQCACTKLRDLAIGVLKQLHIWNPDPNLPIQYSLYNFLWEDDD